MAAAYAELATGVRLVFGGVAHGGYIDKLDLRACMWRANLATTLVIVPESPGGGTKVLRAAIA